MPIAASPHALLASVLFAVVAVGTLSCAAASPVVPADLRLPPGTYGGDSGGMIVGDTSMHLHIGCTFGDVSGRVPVDANGRFDVAGSYTLRAYPIAVGPPVPARFTGSIDGDRIVVTATIDDTVEKRTVVRGPVALRLGVEPKLGPCPICRKSGGPVFRWSGTTNGLGRQMLPEAVRGLPDFRTPGLPTAWTLRSPPSTTSAALPAAHAAFRRSSS